MRATSMDKTKSQKNTNFGNLGGIGMAKYTVNYSCGHKGVLELFGPHKDRYSKIDWLEEKGLCPDCYKASIPQHIYLQNIYVGEDLPTTLIITLSGNTYPIKEKLKALGFKYNTILGWYKAVEVSSEEDILNAGLEVESKLKEIGNYSLNLSSILDKNTILSGIGERLELDKEARGRLKEMLSERKKEAYDKFISKKNED